MMPPGAEGMMPPGAAGPPQPPTAPGMPKMKGGGAIPPAVLKRALAMLGGGAPGGSQFTEASAPINLLAGGPMPPTVKPLTTNPRGMNRGGKVNTNISTKAPNGPEAQLLNRAQNIQR